jgi:hypothetical protein
LRKKINEKDKEPKKEIRRGDNTVEVRRNGGRGSMHQKSSSNKKKLIQIS